MSTSNSEDESAWRRRLGSAANNRGWSLAEKLNRSAEEDQEMLNAAHASVHLWSTIGTPRNIALGQLLLGQVHALLANPKYAMQHATAAYEYFTSNESAPWELAFAHAVLANAAHCCGNAGLYASSYRQAEALVASLPDPEDRAILQATMNVIPKPTGVDSST
jgi:hypothetical protein